MRIQAIFVPRVPQKKSPALRQGLPPLQRTELLVLVLLAALARVALLTTLTWLLILLARLLVLAALLPTTLTWLLVLLAALLLILVLISHEFAPWVDVLYQGQRALEQGRSITQRLSLLLCVR